MDTGLDEGQLLCPCVHPSYTRPSSHPREGDYLCVLADRKRSADDCKTELDSSPVGFRTIDGPI
jgi:hypothetical protein